MKSIFFIFFVFAFCLYSCEEGIQEVEAFTLEENQSYEKGGSSPEDVLINEVLSDLELFDAQLKANSRSEVEAAFSWYEAKIQEGVEVDTRAFFVERLHISESWFITIEGYTEEKFALLTEEAIATDGKGPISTYYARGGNTQGDEPKGCGFARIANLALSIGDCIISVDNFINGSLYRGTITDCVHAYVAVRDYVRDCW